LKPDLKYEATSHRRASGNPLLVFTNPGPEANQAEALARADLLGSRILPVGIDVAVRLLKCPYEVELDRRVAQHACTEGHVPATYSVSAQSGTHLAPVSACRKSRPHQRCAGRGWIQLLAPAAVAGSAFMCPDPDAHQRPHIRSNCLTELADNSSQTTAYLLLGRA
jgi:hypothetical protein